ncbi:MAG: hypothetical protein ACSHXY_06900 [Alphaproteobacteria bacterium]
MPRSQNGSRPLSTKDKFTLAAIALCITAVLMLMRMDTASWAFNYEDHFIEITETAPPPKLDFTLTQTDEGTVSVVLDLENISLVEFCSGKDQGLAKGHAHVFVDGKKQGSFYIMEYTLANLPKGIHTVTVSLNQPPSHKVLSWKGAPVSVTKSFTVT